MSGQDQGKAAQNGSNGSAAAAASTSRLVARDYSHLHEQETPKARATTLSDDAAKPMQRTSSDFETDAAQWSDLAKDSDPTSKGSNEEADSPPRPLFNRVSTYPDQRVLEDPNVKNRPSHQWSIPVPSKGKRGPRAATLFLGKDYERWQIHDRDNLGLGLKLGWNQRSDSSSAIPSSAGEYVSGEDEEDEYYDSDSFLTDDESATSSSKGSRRSSRRSSRSSRSRSGSGSWKRPGALGGSLQPLTSADSATVTDRIEEHLDRRRKSTSTAASTGGRTSPARSTGSPVGSGFFRPRRFSSNGPDAAFMRHETVIGLHTPRRDSASSMASLGGRQLPAAFERISLTPLSPATPSPPHLSATEHEPSPSGSANIPSGQPSKIDPDSIIREHKPLIGDAKVVASPFSEVPPTAPPPQQQPSTHKDTPVSKLSKDSTKLSRDVSSSDLLKRAAAAAAASASAEPSSESEVEDTPDPTRSRDSGGSSNGASRSSANASPFNGASLSHRSSATSLGRSKSPAVALALARRRKPIRLEGTLYDRSGPFREGAVTDGLSVRLFSAEKTEESAGYADSGDEQQQQPQENAKDPRHRRSKSKSKSKHQRQTSSSHRGVHRHESDATKRAMGQDSAIDDDNEVDADAEDAASGVPQVKDAGSATTYLITTPDNRVASAAKLRRWAMDGQGNFYAAMEIKSVEAKIRSAMDPADAANGSSHSAAYARSLAKILRQTYLDDILNEVQKAETLNPGRKSVAKLLVTSDGKYLRLEEDYPEEAFFVIAGCEDFELYPVVALVFCEALRHIHRFHNAGWMHGDIKLENLMFDAQGNLVVIDYENANPFRIPGGDGCVSLMSFDWVPPEAQPGSDGRRAGPSADLWALGANLVRAFALRDGIDDSYVRETVLEKGQRRFLKYRDSLIKKQGAEDERTTAEDVDLSEILEDAECFAPEKQCEDPSDPNSLPTPQRLLLPFARQAPHLLKFVLASCLSLDTKDRGADAELDGLDLAREIEKERGGETLRVGRKAVETAIRLSGSEWVRPKLDDARRSLGLGEDEEGERVDDAAR